MLTAASLFLGFKIMRINQKDKRREQASLVVFTNYYTSTFGTDDMTLIMIRGTIHNHSAALVTNAAIAVDMTKRTARKRVSVFDRWFRPHKKTVVQHSIRLDDDITGTILPEGSANYRVEIPYDDELTADDVVIKLTFMDANGVEWERAFRGAPVEPRFPSKVRMALIHRLQWRDWDKKMKAEEEAEARAEATADSPPQTDENP